MAAPNLLSLLLLAFLAILALSSAPLHANALVADRAQVARHVHAHPAVARRKRDSSGLSGRCIPRPSSSLDTSATFTSTPAFAPAPATSTTPPPASATPSPTAQSASGPKWGLAWGYDNSYIQNFARPNVGYLYTWSESIPSNLPNGIKAIPMLWGYKNVDAFNQAVTQGPSSYASIALGMNEPNEPSQANMSPQDAANMWRQYMNPLKAKGYYLISPACTDDDSGLQWYQSFFSTCPDCSVDAIAFHAYTNNASHLIEYATTLNTLYGRNVFVTEFADQNFSGTGGEPSMSDVWGYATQVADFVNNTPWLMGSFPFGVVSDLQGVDTNNALVTSAGTPTDLAYFYFG